jgi:hypothetical protein
MPKKIKDCTGDYLTGIPLPVHADTYTVISHENVMDYSKTALINAGFTIEREEYRATADGQIAQGVFRLHYGTDQELSMMFAWTNSYNKQVRFKCGVGAYINTNGTVMVCGEMGNWARKHTGTADTETIATITEQVTNAHMYYNQLVSDKNVMQTISMTKRKQAQLLGILFAEYQILTTEQASIVRQQMDKPSYVFADNNSLWAFYNYVTLALQQSHPKTWMEDQRILHYFINSVNNFPVCSQPAQVPVEEVIITEDIVDAIDPNQISLLDQIADMEADMMDEDVRYAANDEEKIYDEIEVEELALEQPEESILQYTDKDGNTFESIEFHNAVVEPSLEIHKQFEDDMEQDMSIEEKDDLQDFADLNVLDENPNKIKSSESDFDLDFISTEDNTNKEEDLSDFF